jgi:protein-S-isoprenylcysteine O-methyltransferase Ste14
MTAHDPDHAQVRILPPFVFFGHLAAALLLGWFIRLPVPVPFLVRFLGVLIVLGGLALAWSAGRAIAAAHTPLDPYQPVTALVIQGPYRFTRNPFYLSFLAALIGLPLALGTYWGLLMSPVMIVLMTQLVIRYEEIYLEQKFGQDYLNYRANVHRWW